MSVPLPILIALYEQAPLEVHVWKLRYGDRGQIVGWTLVHANSRALEAWGRSLDQVVGKNNEELFPGSDSTGLFLPIVERIVSTGEPYEWEEGIPDTYQILRMTSIPVDDHFISCGMDVGAYRSVEAQLSSKSVALDHSMRCLKIATESAQIGIWEYDLEKGTLIWDKSMYSIYGVEPMDAQLPYEVWRSGVHPDDIDEATRDLKIAVETSRMFKSDFRIVRKDTGEVRYIEAQALVDKDRRRKTTRMIGVNIDRTERRQAELKVEHLAYFDTLTDLPNRSSIELSITRAIDRSERSGKSGALILVDLDNFKQVNDSVGHKLGDELLVVLSHRLESLVSSPDTVGRFGGDEFALILNGLDDNPDVAIETAEKFGAMVRDRIREPMQLTAGKFLTSASLGITLFQDSTLEPSDLLRQAELAMYQAKALGRGTMQIFDVKLERDFIQRVALERDLGPAIENNELELHYQPQFDAEGRVRGVEALVRFNHPDYGPIPPEKLIRVAEESGQIRALGLWVVRTALQDLRMRFDPVAADRFRISVNVSALQFYDPDFTEKLKSEVDSSGIDASRLTIELTESALNASESVVSEKMVSLQALGMQFALDDFGTGYSSLTRLKQLPIDELKIDQSFVRDITTNANSRAIVSSVITLSAAMGINVVAEGVETQAHRRALKDMGCQLYQGYLFSRPIGADALVEMLRSRRWSAAM
mgnify:CR=1 FL=1